jgi:hypothetical protein
MIKKMRGGEMKQGYDKLQPVLSNSLNFSTVNYRINYYYYFLCSQQVKFLPLQPFLIPSTYLHTP